MECSLDNANSNVGKILLIGATGGTGRNVVKGFLERGVSNLQAITRKIDSTRPELAKLINAGVTLVEGNLDEPSTLLSAFTGVSAVYCHALAPDTSKIDTREVERAKIVAQIAKNANIKHLVYNSAGGAERNTGISRIEQKYQVEQIFKQAGLPTTMLRACLFMEEFWKKYTRPSILKGRFSFAIQPEKLIHLIANQDMGRVAAYVMQNSNQYIGRDIELAGDVLSPIEMTAAFSQAQKTTVVYKETPAWIFLLLFRKELYDLIQWYRNQGYNADVKQLRQEFPELLTTFSEFLEQTNWANPALTYKDL